MVDVLIFEVMTPSGNRLLFDEVTFVYQEDTILRFWCSTEILGIVEEVFAPEKQWIPSIDYLDKQVTSLDNPPKLSPHFNVFLVGSYMDVVGLLDSG